MTDNLTPEHRLRTMRVVKGKRTKPEKNHTSKKAKQ